MLMLSFLPFLLIEEPTDLMPGSGSGSGMPLGPFPPRIITLSDQNITVNIATRLFINISYDVGNPQGFLVWRFNERIISSRTDPRVTMLGGGGLTIRDVTPSDGGQYTVTVTNEVGSDSRLFNVLVEQCKIHLVIGPLSAFQGISLCT